MFYSPQSSKESIQIPSGVNRNMKRQTTLELQLPRYIPRYSRIEYLSNSLFLAWQKVHYRLESSSSGRIVNLYLFVKKNPFNLGVFSQMLQNKVVFCTSFKNTSIHITLIQVPVYWKNLSAYSLEQTWWTRLLPVLKRRKYERIKSFKISSHQGSCHEYLQNHPASYHLLNIMKNSSRFMLIPRAKTRKLLTRSHWRTYDCCLCATGSVS